MALQPDGSLVVVGETGSDGQDAVITRRLTTADSGPAPVPVPPRCPPVGTDPVTAAVWMVNF